MVEISSFSANLDIIPLIIAAAIANSAKLSFTEGRVRSGASCVDVLPHAAATTATAVTANKTNADAAIYNPIELAPL